MSLNNSHQNNGVLLHYGELILLHSDNVTIEFSGQDSSIFQGSKKGRIFLTSHRVVFINKKTTDVLLSFSAPFISLSDVDIEQPVFGSNYIKGKVRAEPNGNYIGEVKFKLYFKSGGAIEYGTALSRAVSMAQQNLHNGPPQYDYNPPQYDNNPPPYGPNVPAYGPNAPPYGPNSPPYEGSQPPPYQPPPGYYGWLPTHDAFSAPPQNAVYMSDLPPPYPGINPGRK